MQMCPSNIWTVHATTIVLSVIRGTTSGRRQALSLFETAKAPRTTVKAPFSWKEDGVVWRARYGRVDSADKGRLPKIGEERRRQQATARQLAAAAERDIPGLLHADPSEEADA